MREENKYLIWDYPDIWSFDTLEEAQTKAKEIDKEIIDGGVVYRESFVIIYKAHQLVDHTGVVADVK